MHTQPPAPDSGTVPELLTDHDQWICWRTETRDDEPTKVPVDPNDPPAHASSTDPSTWGSYELAHATWTDGDYDGVGFVFGENDVIAGIDLDDVVDLDNPADADRHATEPWAAEIVERFASYTELSPSGTGFHIYVVAIHPDHGEARNKREQERTLGELDHLDTPAIEMYDRGRFFTFTGTPVLDAPSGVEQRSQLYKEIHDEYVAGDDEEERRNDIDIDVEPPEHEGVFTNAFGIPLPAVTRRDEKLEALLHSIEPGYSLQHDDDSASGYDLATASKLWFWRFDEQTIADILATERTRYKTVHRSDYVRRTLARACGADRDRYGPDFEFDEYERELITQAFDEDDGETTLIQFMPRCPWCDLPMGPHARWESYEHRWQCTSCREVYDSEEVLGL